MTKKLIFTIAMAFAAIPTFAADNKYVKLYEKLPVELAAPSLPQIPDNTVYLQDFGGKADGKTDNTQAFADAISELSKMGGGHLIVGKGTWITGPIVLKSKIDLHLDKGALVQFTPDKRAYFDKLSDGSFDTSKKAKACISTNKASDISITGQGVLDGNGQYWRFAKRNKYSDKEWKELTDLGGTISPDGKNWFPYNLTGYDNLTDSPEKEEAIRNHMVIIKRVERLLISGVTIRNSPKFHINPEMCTDIILDGVTVKCNWNAQNGDGIDINNSQRVLITKCSVDCGDDGICMKGGNGEIGLKAGPCKDILIYDNTVFKAHGGFVIGSDFSGGMENIVVRKCRFIGSDTGLRFKSMPGRGGSCKNIYIYDIDMNDIKNEAVTFSCDYSDVTYKTLKSGNGTTETFIPDFTDIHISNVYCKGSKYAIRASGIPGMKCVHGVTISNCSFTNCKKGNDINEAEAEISLSEVKVE